MPVTSCDPASTCLYPNYPACVPELKNAGTNSLVIGYIRTNYTSKAIADVEADVDNYATWATTYRPSGIFFDEVSNDAASVSQYASYAAYARSKGFDFVRLSLASAIYNILIWLWYRLYSTPERRPTPATSAQQT